MPDRTSAQLIDHEISVLAATLTAESLADTADDDRGWRSKSRPRLVRDYSAWTLDDLTAARDQSRDLLRRNAFAIGAIRNRVNYCVDLGFTYTVVPATGVDKTAAAGVLEAVQQYVDAFAEFNDLPNLEAEALLRVDRDGEFILRLFPNAGEIPEVRFVEPDVLGDLEQQQERNLPSGSVRRLGVVTPVNDAGQVLGYMIGDKFVSEGEVVHGRFNADSAFSRGVPLFDPIDQQLRECADLWKAMSSTAKARAKIAVLWKLKQINAATESNMAQRLLSGTQTNASGDKIPVNVEQMPFGAVLRINGQTTDSVDFPNANLGAGDAVQVLTSGLQACAVAVTMPAWMFSGDASEKYANAFVGEAPALKGFKRLQKRLVTLFGEGRLSQRASLVWRAVRMGVEAGLLPAEAITAAKVTCTPPTLEVRDASAESSTNSTYNAMGVKSIQTIQEQLSLDPDKENQRIEEERKKGLGAAFAYKAQQAQLGNTGMNPGGALPPQGQATAGA